MYAIVMVEIGKNQVQYIKRLYTELLNCTNHNLNLTDRFKKTISYCIRILEEKQWRVEQYSLFLLIPTYKEEEFYFLYETRLNNGVKIYSEFINYYKFNDSIYDSTENETVFHTFLKDTFDRFDVIDILLDEYKKYAKTPTPGLDKFDYEILDLLIEYSNGNKLLTGKDYFLIAEFALKYDLSIVY